MTRAYQIFGKSSDIHDGAIYSQCRQNKLAVLFIYAVLNRTEKKSVCCRAEFKSSFLSLESLHSVIQLSMGSIEKQQISRVQSDSDTSQGQCDKDTSRVQCDKDTSQGQCDEDTSQRQCDKDTSQGQCDARVQCNKDTSQGQCDERVQCDSDTSQEQCDSLAQFDGGVPVKLNRAKRGGSYVEMLRSGDLDLAYSTQSSQLCK